jgi:hypothetical protein
LLITKLELGSCPQATISTHEILISQGLVYHCIEFIKESSSLTLQAPAS